VGFTHAKNRKKTLLPRAFWMHGAHNTCPGLMWVSMWQCPRRMALSLGSWHALGVCVGISGPNSPFFYRFRCFSPNNVWGSRNWIPPSCKVYWGLLNLLSWSSQSLHKSSDVLDLPICMISSWITSKTPENCYVLGKLELQAQI